MSTVTVDQQKLVLNAFAMIFQNNLVSSDVVTWKKYDTEMNDRNGLNVAEQVGPRYNVTTTTNGVKDLSAGVQDSVFGSEQFIVNKTFGTSMGWADFVKIRDVGAARESEALKNAALNLAEVIDAYVLETATLAFNNWVGDAANSDPVATYGDMATAYTRLKEEGVDDADLRAVLSFKDRQELAETVIAYNATDSLSTSTFRKGFVGEVDGIPTMFTQQLPSFTVGTRVATGSVAVDGANQNVNYSDVAISSAPGFYLTQEIDITLPSGATVVAGDVFTISGVKAYDNRAGKALDHDQQFTVITGATGNVSNDATIRIFPAIIVPGTGTGGDIDVNTAHATVSAVPGATAAISFLGATGATLKPRVLLQKGSILVNTAPLIMPATGQASRKDLTRVPLSVRMWQHSDFDTGQHSVRFDVALTANVRDRRRGVRLNGTSA